jgi:hypothetical protein
MRSHYARRLKLFTKITGLCNHAAALKRWATSYEARLRGLSALICKGS